MKLGDAVLDYALATPLCRLKSEVGESYVFYGDRKPDYQWQDGKQAEIIHLSRVDALNAWRVTLDRDYLILSENYVWEQEGELHMTCTPGQCVKAYPKLPKLPAGMKQTGTDGIFTIYEYEGCCGEVSCCIEEIAVSEAVLNNGIGNANGNKAQQSAGDRKGDHADRAYRLKLTYEKAFSRVKGEDVLLNLTYDANGMDIYLEGKKVNDYLYTGQKAVFSLGYFDFPKELTVIVHPLKKDEPVFLETYPEFEDGVACRIRNVEQTVLKEVIC